MGLAQRYTRKFVVAGWFAFKTTERVGAFPTRHTRLRPTWLYCLRVGPLPLSQPESGFLDRSCCLSHRTQSKIVFKIGMNTQVQVMLGLLPALRKANSSKQKTALVEKAQKAVPQVCFTSTRRPTHILDGSPLNCLFAAERHKPNFGRFGRLSASKLDSALRLELLHLDKIDFVQKTQMILDSGRETQGYIKIRKQARPRWETWSLGLHSLSVRK